MKNQPNSLTAVVAYLAISILLTWPLARGLASDVPGDLGDALLNMWILAWGAEHVPQLLTGSMSWQAFWNANIFHPEPLALTFSEHLFGQTLQILPVYWLTGNIILCYNLLFLSTFALSGLGVYLLVRDLTGDRRAAFVAGLVYGFLPYRIASIPHVQVMSAQWMPFALYGLNRFVAGPPSRPEAATARSRRSSPALSRAEADSPGSLWALAGGTAALVMQNWSCGYYLLYFAPFAPLFVMHRMWSMGTLKSARAWMSLAAASGVTMLLTLPFLLPYIDARRVFGFERSLGEVVLYSANVWSYATASEHLWLWGKTLRYFPHGEGETFLGVMPWILAVVGFAGLLLEPGVTHEGGRPRGGLWLRALAGLLTFAVISQFIALSSVVVGGGFDVEILGLSISARTPQRLLMQFVVAAALLLLVSARVRVTAARLSRTPFVFFASATAVAMWLSLGPMPKAGDTYVSGFGLYGVLYDYVPGFNGVRVPARYAMIAGLFLSVLAGYGATALLNLRRVGAFSVARRAAAGLGAAPEDTAGRRRSGTFMRSTLALAIGALILVDGAAIPLEINRAWGQNEATPPARIFPATNVPPVYSRIAALPAGSAITEFPFGDAAWEIRYVYYAHAHWKPITNGYSGAFPPAYKARVARWHRVTVDPDGAWRALIDSGTTHVVLHPGAFANPADAAAVEAWLRGHRASEVEHFTDGDTLFELGTETPR